MKGIIAEIHRNHMIVIAKNGDFVKCKKLPNCDIGDEINIPETSMAVNYKRFTAIAASFIIIAMLFTGVYAYYTPYSYISVDINPSLELYVNRFDRVIEVHAFNEDAKKVLEASNGIKNKNVDAVLEKILDSAANAGYIKQEDENSVMIVVSSNSKKTEEDLTRKVSETSTQVLSDITDNYEIILEKAKVETYKKAKEENVSPGKVILAHQLKEVKPDIDEEKIKHMPLKQAIKEIEEKNEEKPDTAIATAAVEQPDSESSKKETKNNVMNIRELIKEKNKELAKKLQELEKEKEKEKNKDKDKYNSKDKENKESKEKLNQNNKDNKDQKDNKWNNRDNDDQDQKKNNNQDKYDKKDDKNKDNKNQNNKWEDKDNDNNKWRNRDKDD